MSRLKLVLFLTLFPLASFSAQAEKVSCDKISDQQTVYLNYGIKTPPKDSQWLCFGSSPKEKRVVFLWQNGNKKITIGDEEKLVLSDEAIKAYSVNKEPSRELRFFSDVFLADELFVRKNSWAADYIPVYSGRVKGIFYSKNNERAVVYTQEERESNESHQGVQIFNKSGKGTHLDVECTGCTTDEFFSLIILPAIQN